jgi:hypothetical protein
MVQSHQPGSRPLSDWPSTLRLYPGLPGAFTTQNCNLGDHVWPIGGNLYYRWYLYLIIFASNFRIAVDGLIFIQVTIVSGLITRTALFSQ